MLKIPSKHLIIVNIITSTNLLQKTYPNRWKILAINQDVSLEENTVSVKMKVFVNLENLKSFGIAVAPILGCQSVLCGLSFVWLFPWMILFPSGERWHLKSFWGWHANNNIARMDEVTRSFVTFVTKYITWEKYAKSTIDAIDLSYSVHLQLDSSLDLPERPQTSTFSNQRVMRPSDVPPAAYTAAVPLNIPSLTAELGTFWGSVLDPKTVRFYTDDVAGSRRLGAQTQGFGSLLSQCLKPTATMCGQLVDVASAPLRFDWLQCVKKRHVSTDYGPTHQVFW